MRKAHRPLALCLSLALAGCFSYPVNPPLDRSSLSKGYRYGALAETDSEKNSEETFVILTFSGGGTRASAFAYGVLKKLKATPIDGHRKTLLDEVDVISSVSGGSFAAAYYGLFGEEAFFREFEAAVLHRAIERDLLLAVVAPWNWPWLLSRRYGRSDLADYYYNRHLFRGRRFADLPRKRPYIILNATDMSLGAQFSFTQEHFDRLCSDLSGVHVSRAVTASSAFPVAFTPLTFKNYPRSTCGYTAPEWVNLAAENDAEINPRRYHLAQTWKSYEDPARRFIHLNDGGLADNIGLRGPEFAIDSNDPEWSLFNKVNNGDVKRIVVIVVDAKPKSDRRRDRHTRPPGIYAVLNAAATNPMENYSSDTVELLRERFSEWNKAARNFERRYEVITQRCDDFAKELCAAARPNRACEEEHRTQCYAHFRETEEDRPAHPDLYYIHLRFDAVKDPDLRRWLERIPTSLQLPREDIDVVIGAATTLLDESQAYQRLLRDLAAVDASGSNGEPQ